ncbi:type II secretion system minor pseudopilin GspI [Aliikangiella maris]|uniref:Type II secretion system minor pseudopilin GspI n=2 Tax=Aliikangiella maris TaxID=3162458 RepID=A0ABV3MTE3_9GAMM
MMNRLQKAAVKPRAQRLRFSGKGFTLLEVLIAMVIFGTTVAFLVRNLTEQQRAHTDIGVRTIAHWVALNKMAEVRMAEQWPDIGVTRGDMEMRDHKWYWLQTVSNTSEKQLRQVEIEVRMEQDDENPSTRFIGFIANKVQNENSRL